ncbi:ribonuclease H protein [Pyrus ussuriensis x Pyrus communis]|uniref:Ribonuclease H protein n=1 Tax=Pyrus ussuriensis x Pyrus communis TaxID=2448454 RepID=A0A5N5FC73_9ROSA|nr:ribonuclease H protein [Pyrus ussuriensis x Pyrus communis]
MLHTLIVMPCGRLRYVTGECSFSQAVWCAAHVELSGEDSGLDTVKEWVMHLLEKDGVNFDAVLMLMWSLWTERNKFLWKETIGQIERRWGCEVGEGVGGAGAVIGGGWRSQGCCSIKQVELLAIREGIRLALRFGLLRLQVETDSIEAKEACKGDLADL